MKPATDMELITRLYDAALSRADWQDVADLITQSFDSVTLTLAIYRPASSVPDFVASQGFTAAQRQAYQEHFFALDPVAAEAMRRQVFNRAVLGSDLVDDGTLRRSAIYNEFLRPDLKAFHLLGGELPLPHGELVVFGTHRPEEARPFVHADARRLDRLLPHLRRALEMRQTLHLAEARARSLQGALDMLPCGAVIVASDGRITHANAIAERMLAQGDGLGQRDQRLHAVRADQHSRLRRAIEHAGRTTCLLAGGEVAGHLRIDRGSGQRPYQLMVCPLGSDREALRAGHAVAVVFINDPDGAPGLEPDLVQALLDLTPAEARVVAMLASGVPLPQIGAATRTSYNTVRTLLARAMTKTQTTSQVDLVRLTLAVSAVAMPAR